MEEEDQQHPVQYAVQMSPAMEGQNQPPFYPHLRQAQVEPSQLSVLSGGGRIFALAEIDGGYLRGGFAADNTGEI
jgi:hypothetical protein